MTRFVSILVLLATLSVAGCEPGSSAPGASEVSSASTPPPVPPEPAAPDSTPLPPIMRRRAYEKKQLPVPAAPLSEGPSPRTVDSTATTAATTPLTEAGDPVDSYIEQLERLVDTSQQMCALLTGATDQASGRAAAEQIRAMLPDYASANRELTATYTRFSDQQRNRVMMSLAQRDRPQGADVFGAAEQALRGPAREELRPVLREVMQAHIDAVPTLKLKQQVRERIQKLGL